MPFKPGITTDKGYFRFHGRNRRWYNQSVSIRYDYLYSEEELVEFVSPVKDVASKSSATYVYFNNCHVGKAALNARQFKTLLYRAS